MRNGSHQLLARTTSAQRTTNIQGASRLSMKDCRGAGLSDACSGVVLRTERGHEHHRALAPITVHPWGSGATPPGLSSTRRKRRDVQLEAKFTKFRIELQDGPPSASTHALAVVHGRHELLQKRCR